MADISKVKLPGNDTIYYIKDARIAYGTCSAASATAAKTVAATGFTLTTGARVAVKFIVTNTAANPTLNVNNTGAKAIYYRGVAITAGYLAANRTYEFIYNGTQYELVGDLDTNTNTNVTTSPITSGTIYITGKTSNAANNNSTEVLNSNVTIDASAGKIKTNATASTDDNSVVTTKGYVDSLIGESVSGITGAMHFKGTVTSVPASSSLYLNGSETATTMQEGDVVIYDSKEYVFDGTNWHELGDESHHIPVVTGASGQVPKFTSTGTLASTGYELNKTVPSNAVFTDVSVTASANHYTPATVSGQDKTASASGATAAWDIDVVKGVTLNTDGKGHVTGLSVTSGKIPANPNTDTHYTTHVYAGSGSAANAATTNGNTKLTVVDNTTVRDNITVKGAGSVAVTSDANGVITITGTDNDTNTIPSAHCDTAAATKDKVASCTNYALQGNTYTHVLITVANTAQDALTLNINNRGAKPIYINGAASSSSNYTLPAGTYLVYFDGTNYYFRTDGVLAKTSYTPAGSVTVTPSVTAPTTTVNSITAVGTLPSCTMPTYSVDDEILTITAGSFSAGTLPTKGADTTVVKSVSVTATGSFSGTAATISVKGN